MSQCDKHGYYSGPFCLECTTGEHSAQEAGYRLFNEDRSLGQNQYASRYVDGMLSKILSVSLALAPLILMIWVIWQ